MFDPRNFEEIARSISRLLPPGATELKEEFERNVKAALQSSLSRLDLVTREEFDVHSRLLQSAREHIDALEARIAALEAASGSKTAGRGAAKK